MLLFFEILLLYPLFCDILIHRQKAEQLNANTSDARWQNAMKKIYLETETKEKIMAYSTCDRVHPQKNNKRTNIVWT